MTYSSTILADTPIAYYRLDQTSGTTALDSSGNGYHASVAGATLGQAGALASDTNTCMLFTAGGGLTLPFTFNPNVWTTETLEFWTNIGTGWHHVVTVVTAGGTIYYLDGAVSSASSVGPLLIESSLDYAGSWTVSGYLDEVAVYSSALSATQVSAHYAASLSTSLPHTRYGSGRLKLLSLAPTALTLYGSKLASGTLTAAATFASGTGGVESGTSTAVNTATTGTYLEIWGKGTATAQNAVLALPAPTGNGWLFDTTTLEGKTIAAGSWTPTVSLTNTFMSLTGVTIYVRFYKRSSGGVYTAIGTASVVNKTITTSKVTFAVTAASLAATTFATGDKLYVDLFLYASANWGGASYTVSTYESSNASGVASDMQIATPGYTTVGGVTTVFGSGRAKIRAGMTRFGTGRMALAIHNARLATGRMRLQVKQTLDGMGRFALALRKTSVSQGRTAIRATTTRFAQGRLRLAAAQRLFGMGRAKIRASMTRLAAGRFFLVGAHRLLASGRASIQVGKRLLSAGRLRLVVAQRLLARGRFSIKAGRRVIAQGRTALRAMQTRLAQGRFALLAFFQQTRKAVGRVAIAVSFGGAGYASTILADSPTAYYRLGEASGTSALDASGNGNTATSTGGVTLGAVGALTNDANTAYSFNGSTGYVTLPAGLSPTGLTVFSVECWFNTSNYGAGNMRFLANGHTDSDKNGFQLYFDGARIRFQVGDGSTMATAITTAAISNNAWYHLVATYDGTTLRIYQNGVAGTPANFSSAITSDDQAISIGRNPVYNGDYFVGVMDEVAIYKNIALSSTQIQNHYAAQSATLSTRPTASGRFAVQSLLSHRLFAQGRANIRVAFTRASQGRLALWITTHQTRLAQGRVALRATITRVAQGRFSLQSAFGQTRKALGRLLLRVPFTRSAQGRTAIAVRRTLVGMGRAKILAAGRRLAAGRLSLALRHTFISSGRTAIRAGHTLLGAGRFALILIGSHTRYAIGRYTMRANKTRFAVARFLTSVKQTRLASGRMRLSARITRLATGRVAVYVPRRFAAMGRMVLTVAARRFGMARFKLALERTYQARARVAIAAMQRLLGVGRFRVMVRKTANSQGRAGFRVQMTRQAKGRAVFQVRRSLFGGGRLALRQGVAQRRWGMGRAKIRAGAQRAAIARFLVHIVQAHASVGRLHVSVSRRTTGVGRFAMVPTDFSDITVQGTAGQVTVQGTSGQITTQGTSGTITVVGSAGVVTVTQTDGSIQEEGA